jgi:hypothetical protein
MHRFRTLMLAAFVLLALSAVAATAAQAEGPFYSTCTKKEGTKCVERKRLEAGQTLIPTAEATEAFTLEAATKQVIKCSKLSLEKATLQGSAKGTGGSGEQTDVFSGCEVKNNGAACEVEGGKIKTEPLKSTLDKENEKAVKGEKLLVSFQPVKGAVFVKVKFTGTCTLKETAIELKGGVKLGVAGTLDLAKAGSEGGHEAIKLEENEELAETGLIHFPPTLLKTEWFEEGGKATEIKEGLVAFGQAVTKFEGHAKVTVAGTDWGVFGV